MLRLLRLTLLWLNVYPHTVATYMPAASERLRVIEMDALKATPDNTANRSEHPLTLVANLPYNVATQLFLLYLSGLYQY